MKTKRQKWQAWELAWVDCAIQSMYAGCSIYSEIKFLNSEVLWHRTWDSIRSKIKRKLKANKDLLLLKYKESK